MKLALATLLLGCLLVNGAMGQLENVAMDKPAKMSSQYSIYNAQMANDDRTVQNQAYGSCAMTAYGANQWWSVNLLDLYYVKSVRIYAQNALASRLGNFDVWVGSSENDLHICASFPNTASNYQVISLLCDEKNIQYVKILSSKPTYLTLCEVQVIGIKQAARAEAALVSHNHPTRQSSNYVAWSRSLLAVDGNSYAVWGGLSCSGTTYQDNPWWMVDLENNFVIERVAVYARAADATRLRNYEVSVSNDGATNLQRCFHHSGRTSNYAIAIGLCPSNLVGRYVHLQITGKEYLFVCEVKVYGVYAGK